MQPGKFIVRQLVQSAVVKDHPRSAHDGLEQLDCDTSEGGQLPDRGGGIHGQAEALQQFLAARASARRRMNTGYPGAERITNRFSVTVIR